MCAAVVVTSLCQVAGASAATLRLVPTEDLPVLASIVVYLCSLVVSLLCMLLLLGIVRLVDCALVLYVCTLLRSYDCKQLLLM